MWETMVCILIRRNKNTLLFIVNVDWFFVSHRLPIALKAIEVLFMPTNLYGENDNFHPENSHVIPALTKGAAIK